MTAEQARSKSDIINSKLNSEKITEIENKIRYAVDSGKYSIFTSDINDYVKTHFMQLGYEVISSRDPKDVGLYIINW